MLLSHQVCSNSILEGGVPVLKFNRSHDESFDFNISQIVMKSGGTVCVFRGLLDVLESEAQLAAVIAHEMGHAVASMIFHSACITFAK